MIMISEDTALILGAGASQPYGYPIGIQLRENIINHLDSNKPGYQALRSIGFSRSDILEFRTDLKGSMTYNIDDFLQYREDLKEIGKVSIAYMINSCEYKKNLLNPKEELDWYRYLYNRILTNFNDLKNNKINIITFNYDRSLEEYIFNALKRHYKKSDEECKHNIDKLNIIHVYGQLDSLPWQDNSGRPYDHNYDYRKYLEISAKGIQTLEEIKSSTINQIHTALEMAKKIYFLGFGYGESNLKLLKIKNILKSSDSDGKRKEINGTAYGVSDPNRIKIMGQFNTINLGDSRTGCLQFLNDYGF